MLVIGGGATGLGTALDSQTRGLSTCLLERNDFGAGTSSRSTKLIHGGIRYLENAFKVGVLMTKGGVTFVVVVVVVCVCAAAADGLLPL